VPPPCPIKRPLEAGWPQVAQQMEDRTERSHFSNVVEQTMAIKIASGKETEFNRRAAYYSYVGVNPACTTPSFSMTMTDPYKETKALLNNPVELPLPLWIPKVSQQAKL